MLTMSSRWGAQMEGDAYDINNLIMKVHGSISSPSSFFVTMINSVAVLRSSAWDNAQNHSDAYQLAVGDLAMIQGCINALDGCLPLTLGTIYEFVDSTFNMVRQTPFEVLFRKDPSELAPAIDFSEIMNKIKNQETLRTAFVDLLPDASWIDIYRCWESLKTYYGGEHEVYQKFPSEKDKIKNLKRTANSFRHIHSYDVINNPMTRGDAIDYLKKLVIRAAEQHPSPIAPQDTFTTEKQVEVLNYNCPPEQPVALNKLILSSPTTTQ